MHKGKVDPLSVAAKTGEIVLPLAGDWVSRSMDGGFYYRSRIELLRLGLAFSDHYSDTSSLDYNQRFLNVLEDLAVDEAISFAIFKLAGAPLSTLDTILTSFEPIVRDAPNYSARLQDEFQKQIKEEQKKDPNYKLTFSERLMMSKLADSRAKEDVFKSIVTGYNKARDYIKGAAKSVLSSQNDKQNSDNFKIDDLNFMVEMGLATSNINEFIEEFIKNKEAKIFVKQTREKLKGNSFVSKAKNALKKENEVFLKNYGVKGKEISPQGHTKIYKVIKTHDEIAKTEKIDLKRTLVAFGDIKNIGILLKDKNIEKMGRVGELGVTIFANFKSLGIALTEGGVLAAFNPASAIFVAGLSLVKIFSHQQNKEEQFNKELLKQLQAISGQIQALHQEMRSHFEQVYRNQGQILKTLIDGVDYLDRVFREGVTDLRLSLTVQLDKASLSIVRLQELMVLQHLQQFLQTFPVVLEIA